MDRILQFITEKAFNETIALLLFVGGVLLGAILAYIVYKLFAIKNKKTKSPSTVKDLTLLKREAVEIFINNGNEWETF